MDSLGSLDWLHSLLGPTAVVQRVLSGGTSRQTMLVTVADRASPLVVRRESGAGPFEGSPFSLGREAAVCDAIADRGLPVSRPVAIAADGTCVGNSEIIVQQSEGTTMAWQESTLVLPEHRGHRLGLALKVATHRVLGERAPHVAALVTFNSHVNPWMIGINEKLGYIAHAEAPD